MDIEINEIIEAEKINQWKIKKEDLSIPGYLTFNNELTYKVLESFIKFD